MVIRDGEIATKYARVGKKGQRTDAATIAGAEGDVGIGEKNI